MENRKIPLFFIRHLFLFLNF